MQQFNPSNISLEPVAPLSATTAKPRSERVFMTVQSYATPADGFHYAIGNNLDGEMVKVRLNTIAERMEDNPKQDRAKVEALYLNGDKVRDSIAAKEKKGAVLLSFDDARKVGVDAAGVKEYRAHWSTSMSTIPSAEMIRGKAHIELAEAVPDSGRKSQAHVDVLGTPVLMTRDNVQAVLTAALDNVDGEGRKRDPWALMRAVYNEQPVVDSYVWPARERVEKFNQASGEKGEFSVAMPVDRSIEHLFTSDQNPRNDGVRAMVAGLTDRELPTFYDPSEQNRAVMTNLYFGIKEGAVEVEVTPAVRIDFGVDTRKDYLKNKDQTHLAAYNPTEPDPRGGDPRPFKGYTDTVVVVQRHADGEAYAVFANSVAPFPKMEKLKDRPIDPVVLEQIRERKAVLDAGNDQAAGPAV